MVELRAQLRSGECGVSWVPPENTDVVQEGERSLILRDPAAKVTWQVTSSPFPFALDAEHDEALRADVEMSAHEAFDKAWQSSAEGEPPSRRRTEDPTWSPVIELGRLDVRGGQALRLLRRITYQPGNEIIAGHLIVPTAVGHLDFCALARSGFTGLRESLVMAMMNQDRERDLGAAESAAETLAAGGAAEGNGGKPFPRQAAYDDPALDAHFPEHPLSLVRQAITRLCASVAITQTAPRVIDDIQLDEPRCAFAAPPRYVPVPMAAMRMHPTLRMLMRSGVESWNRDIEVWRLDDVRFRRRDPRNELRALARETIAGWAREGATDIKTEVESVNDFDDRPQVQQSVNMKAGGIARKSIFRWWVEPDGVVFRLGSGGPPSIPDVEHVAVLDGVQASWRRLDPVQPSRRPWWRIW
jgi:hypothetical protein